MTVLGHKRPLVRVHKTRTHNAKGNTELMGGLIRHLDMEASRVTSEVQWSAAADDLDSVNAAVGDLAFLSEGRDSYDIARYA